MEKLKSLEPINYVILATLNNSSQDNRIKSHGKLQVYSQNKKIQAKCKDTKVWSHKIRFYPKSCTEVTSMSAKPHRTARFWGWEGSCARGKLSVKRRGGTRRRSLEPCMNHPFLPLPLSLSAEMMTHCWNKREPGGSVARSLDRPQKYNCSFSERSR